MPRKMFPILAAHYERRGILNYPRSIPWDIIAPHEDAALRNHDQTLDKLASRGGLGASEAICVIYPHRLKDYIRVWRDGSEAERFSSEAHAVDELNKLVVEWLVANPESRQLSFSWDKL